MDISPEGTKGEVRDMTEFNKFKGEMDEWVKEFNSRLQGIEINNEILSEQAGDIEHNYELLQEMRAEINRLREELSALRLVQILHLKQNIKLRS